MTWLYITHNINIFIILMKALLGNKLNDICLETLYFLVFKYMLFFYMHDVYKLIQAQVW